MALIISATEPRVQYTATSGQTSFSVPFEFFDNADLKVYNGTTLLTYNSSPSSASQYSVSGAGVSGGGSIVLGGSGATLNDVITIYRDLEISRSTDFPTSGAFQVGSLNTELDKIIAMTQQLQRDLKFSPRAAATTANTYNITFPNLAANKVLSVNSAGTGLEFAQDITDITTIAGIASDVTAVSNIAANVTTVANDATDIGVVSTNIASVNTVATNIADVIKVADDLNEAVSEVETVANDLNEAVSEIDTVANNITDVNTVGNATNINNITLVAGQISPTNNISTVAGLNTEITTVANANSNITTIATDLSGSNTIGTVATDLSGSNTIGTVSTNITNVQDVANNIAGVNSFAERYRVDSSDPSTSLDDGDLVFNTTSNELKFYDGSSWNVVANQDINVQVSGNDSSPGFLNGKLVAGSGISFTENNDGANETLTIASNLIYPTITSIAPDTITNDASNIVITGTNFVITPNVEIISTTGAIYYPNTVTRNSATQLTINATLAVDGTYFIRVENPDGLAGRSSTALLTVSDAPTWTTAAGSLGSVAQGSAFSTTVVATSDSAITYSVQSGALPSGITLNTSTGVISGTESGSDSTETNYNFTLRATDVELQTADRAFTITVTVGINNGIQFN